MAPPRPHSPPLLSPVPLFATPRWSKRLPARSVHVKLIATVCTFLVAVIILLSRPSTHSYIRSKYEDNIPNQVHFVWATDNPDTDIKFRFKDYLSIYGTWFYWKPSTIYLHTNADDAILERARSGASGKWGKLLFQIPNVKVNHMKMPKKAGNGQDLQGLEHKSDFMRTQAVYEFGGVYIDFDVVPLRDIRSLRKSGFNFIGGRQGHGALNSGTFMSKKGGKTIRMWMEQQDDVYNGQWTTHSNDLLTTIGQHLVREPSEMLIMDQMAFAPFTWEVEDNKRLFGIHNESSNLDHAVLPYEEELGDSWDKRKGAPDWAYDWSMTYLLHAFSPSRNNDPVEGFKHISPAYVLSRQSNYALAAYPIARNMYQRGLIDLDDPWDGQDDAGLSD